MFSTVASTSLDTWAWCVIFSNLFTDTWGICGMHKVLWLLMMGQAWCSQLLQFYQFWVCWHVVTYYQYNFFFFTFSLVLNVRQFWCGLIYSRMCLLGCRLTRLRHGIFAHCAYFVCAMVKFSELNKTQSRCFSDEFKNFLCTCICHTI